MENIVRKDVIKGDMNNITKTKIEGITEAMSLILGYLYGQWQDEKEHEGWKVWKDYAEKMENAFDEARTKDYADNAVFVKAHNKPFGLTFDFEGWQVVVCVDMKKCGWKAKKIA